MPNWQLIAKEIVAATHKPFTYKKHHPVSGGCINSSYLMESGSGERYFVKINDRSKLPMFQAEAKGLSEIIQSQTIHAPYPVCHGIAGSHAFLVTEYIDFGRQQNHELLGRQLAKLHKTKAPYYGWHRDNTIGSTPQVNTPQATWSQFWQTNRLHYQLELAAKNGYRGALQKMGRVVKNSVDNLFMDYTPPATVLHGDLWSGNYGFDNRGQPVIFDPALYYGDRETDLAMTELFGGFPPSFYAAYNEVYPLDDGYGIRKDLYNLYHILNHLNLFGHSYLSQAENIMDTLLKKL